MTASDAGEAPRVKPGAGVAVPLNEIFCVAEEPLSALSVRTREPLSAPAVCGVKLIVRVQLAFTGSVAVAEQSVVA